MVSGKSPTHVTVTLVEGARLRIPVHRLDVVDRQKAICTIIKDAGDDPDVTHKAEIGARVQFIPDHSRGLTIDIRGGEGVGRVTKPGLEVPVGEPAINPGPRQMIATAVNEVLATRDRGGRVIVEVFVPEGRRLAQKTLNARLGILGGLSILGTTGIVRPMSHEAYTATIEAALKVAAASGLETVVLTTGRKSERFVQQQWPDKAAEAFIQIGDYFRFGVEAAVNQGLQHIVLAVFFGKAVKMAQGVPNTHAAKQRLALDALARWTLEETRDTALATAVREANTARQVFDWLYPAHPGVVAHVARRMTAVAQNFAGHRAQVRSLIFDYQGALAYDSQTEV
jgi:cobalt-precorrin-5B (C1)-methyltransferase